MVKSKRNPLAYLGWLGVFGLLGLAINALWLKVFVLFFCFFRYWNVIPDELFWSYVRKAAVNAFLTNVLFTSIFFCFCAVNAMVSGNSSYMVEVTGDVAQVSMAYLGHTSLILGGYVISYMITLCAFIFSLMYYRYKEKKEVGDNEC